MDTQVNTENRCKAVLNGLRPPTYFDLQENSILRRLNKTAAPHSLATSVQSTTLNSIRETVSNCIDLQKANLKAVENPVLQEIYGFSLMAECHCFPAMSRTADKANGRLSIELEIVQKAKQLQAEKIKPHILSIGSASLGQEVHLIQSLIKENVKDFKLDLIYAGYANSPPRTPMDITDELKPQFAREFSEIITTGLGGKITMGPKKVESCALLTSELQARITENKLPTHATLELRFFSSVEDYKANISKASAKKSGTRANIIYDVDVSHEFNEKNAMINPALDLTEKTADYFSFNMYNDQTPEEFCLEMRTRSAGNWSKSTFSRIN